MKLTKKISHQAFVLVLSILILIVMSIAGVAIVTLVESEFRENQSRDSYQQALYTAETGLNHAKAWLKKANLPINLVSWSGGGNDISSWCSTNLFVEIPNNNEIFVIKTSETSINLNNILSETDEKREKFQSYEFFWFITFPVIWNGSKYINNQSVIATSTQSPYAKTGSVDESGAKVTNKGSTGYYYQIYSCGRKIPSGSEKTSTVALDSLVKATQ